MNKIIKKADIVLAVILLMFCAGTAVFAYGHGDEGSQICIEVDGELYGTYPLEEDKVIDVDTKLGHNQITIKDGKAYMSEASCPDGYCLGQHSAEGGINNSRQTLVCLPDRVVVSVTGGSDAKEDTFDAVSGSPVGGSSNES
jgi:hypothetical protein